MFLCLRSHAKETQDAHCSEQSDQLTFDEIMCLLEEDEASDQDEASSKQANTSDPAQGSKVKLTVKYDMGWQKRSSGRKYDSKSGVGTMIGEKSGKIVGCDVRIKGCRVCTLAERKQVQPVKHNCCKNFEGSSKAMEADVAAALIESIEKENVEVDTLIMDDDSSTIARVKNVVNHPLKKWSDLMHVKKHVCNKLYSLQRKHRSLSSNVIKYLTKCFTYALRQNKGDAGKVKAAIDNIVPHAFGTHDQCGNWCGFAQNPEAYHHKGLPGGKNLSGEGLREDLQGVFSEFSRNAEKLAPCATTLQCESFNNMVASKAPKSRHYSSSGSLSARVNCAVSQKNEGSGYLSKVFSSACISPGKFYNKHAARVDRKRKMDNDFHQTLSYKRRKLEFANKSSEQLRSSELREGTTYQTCVDLSDDRQDVSEIPGPVPKPKYKCLDNKNVTIVCFDLETTGLNSDCEILQIAAMSQDGKNKFDSYVKVCGAVPPKVTEITGLAKSGDDIVLHGQKVNALPVDSVLQQFITWLGSLQHVVLVAHNCKLFDSVRLMYHIRNNNLIPQFSEHVVAFADTRPLFAELYPTLPNVKQVTVVSHVLSESYDAHNAIHDVAALCKALSVSQGDKHVMKYSFLVSDVLLTLKRSENVKEFLPSLQSLINTKADKRAFGVAMATKIAGSGLGLQHLKSAHRRDGQQGLLRLFSEYDSLGQIRVTKSVKVVDSVKKLLEQV